MNLNMKTLQHLVLPEHPIDRSISEITLYDKSILLDLIQNNHILDPFQ